MEIDSYSSSSIDFGGSDFGAGSDYSSYSSSGLDSGSSWSPSFDSGSIYDSGSSFNDGFGYGGSSSGAGSSGPWSNESLFGPSRSSSSLFGSSSLGSSSLFDSPSGSSSLLFDSSPVSSWSAFDSGSASSSWDRFDPLGSWNSTTGFDPLGSSLSSPGSLLAPIGLGPASSFSFGSPFVGGDGSSFSPLSSDFGLGSSGSWFDTGTAADPFGFGVTAFAPTTGMNLLAAGPSWTSNLADIWTPTIDDLSPNTLGQSVVTLNDAWYRTQYHAANDRASASALSAIAQAEAENNPAKALAAAYEGSQARIDNRAVAREGLSRGGLELSKAVDRSNPPSFYENLARSRLGPDASEFDVARKMAEGVAHTNPRVDKLLTASKVLGPVGLAYGAYDSYNEISSAADKPQAVVKEAGGWIGGGYGASWGAAAGVAAAVALGSNPVGWGIIAAGLLGGAAGGVIGSMGGKYVAGNAYDTVKSWFK